MAHWALLRCYDRGVSTVKLCTLICAYGTWTPLPDAPHISERKQKDMSNQLHINIFLTERYSLCKEIYKSFISHTCSPCREIYSLCNARALWGFSFFYGGSAENIILRQAHGSGFWVASPPCMLGGPCVLPQRFSYCKRSVLCWFQMLSQGEYTKLNKARQLLE